MKYYSTRDKSKSKLFTLSEAAFKGLAPDGGLFMPETFPKADLNILKKLSASSFADMASYIAKLFFGDEIPHDIIIETVKDAYNFPVPFIEVEQGKYTLQLFHGPTFAFKDFGARFMGRVMGYLNHGNSKQITVLTATSGDTGSAVAHGFWNVPGIKVIILFPEGKVSDFQQAQMTSLGGNIYPLSVKGNFDDCQRLVKEMFNDSTLRENVNITSANSINILRWIPQSFYYFWGYAKWVEAIGSDVSPDIIVPSGNFGNITAGMLAWKMGLPVNRFIAGTNANDVVVKYLCGEKYCPKESIQTVANAMDVGAPSNFERLMSIFSDQDEMVRKMTAGYSFSDDKIREEIKRLYLQGKYESDPHSAVGSLAYDNAGAKGFYISTAHSAKFSNVIKQSIATEPTIPEIFNTIQKLERNFETIAADGQQLKDYIIAKNI